MPLVTTKTVPTTGPGGLVTLIFSWPPGVVPGTEVWCQYGVVDGAATAGASLTNAVVVTAPQRRQGRAQQRARVGSAYNDRGGRACVVLVGLE